MQIGDKVLVRGTIDEIRKDVVIIKNEGGYFGTVPSEIVTSKPIEPIDKIREEIAAYGSIWVEYTIVDKTESGIEKVVENVLKQAKEQVLDVIDKYKAESEAEDGY